MTFKNPKVVRTVQIIFGILLLFFGINSFAQFMAPPQFNEAGSAFLGALFATGYIFPLMAILWILAAVMFIFNKYSPFAAVLIFPITVNIALFHLFLDFQGWLFALIILILNLELICAHWDAYKSMFR